MRRITKIFRGHSRKAVVVSVISTVVGLLLIGGGAYAALGGTFRPQSSSDIELQRGLVGWWKLDGNATDSTPYRDNGTVSGAVATADREGKTAGALSFDGATNAVSMPDASQLDNGSMTASLWLDLTANIDCDSNNNWRSLISKGSSSGTTTGWDVVLEQNMGVQFDVGTGTSSRSGGIGVGMQLNVPILLTFTYDAATGMRTIYANGVQKYSSAITPAPLSANASPLGLSQGTNSGSCPSGSGHVPGIYDDVRIYNRAISAAEAKALYGQYDASVQAGSSEKGLIGWWKFDDNVNDSTPYRNNGTVSGTSFVGDRKGVGSDAITFNGTSDYVYAKIGNGTYFGGNNKLSVSAWVYVTATSSGPIFGISATPPGGGWNTPFLSLSGTTVYGRIWQVNGNTPLSATVSANAWHHLALTYNPGGTPNEIFYVDGQSVGSGSGTYSPSNATDYFTTYNSGTKPAGVASYLNTPIDDVRAYSRVLSPDEIQAQYASYGSQINLSANPTNTASTGNINQGLVGYWNFNGNAKDSTPYRDNGTVNGATLTTDRFNQANSAYAFIGSSGQSISLPAVGPYRSVGTNSFTVAAWVNTTDSSGQRCVMSTAGGALGFRFGFAGGRPYYLVGDGTHYQEGSIGTATLNDGQWHHLVIVYDHNTTWNLTSYIDGTSTGTVSLPSTITGNVNGTGSFIGSMGGGTNGAVTGSIDAVRFYNRALTLTEVQALYNSGY